MAGKKRLLFKSRAGIQSPLTECLICTRNEQGHLLTVELKEILCSFLEGRNLLSNQTQAKCSAGNSRHCVTLCSGGGGRISWVQLGANYFGGIDLGLAGRDENTWLRTEMAGDGDDSVDKVSATQA